MNDNRRGEEPGQGLFSLEYQLVFLYPLAQFVDQWEMAECPEQAIDDFKSGTDLGVHGRCRSRLPGTDQGKNADAAA